MRVGRLAIGYLLVFSLLTSFAVLTIQSTPTLTVRGFIWPYKVNLEEPAPEKFYLFMWFRWGSGARVRDIDPATIRVEGIPPIEGSAWCWWFLFGFAVNGQQLVDVIWVKVSHMGIPGGDWEKVPLAVTGQLYDGRAFEGTFKVKVYYSNPGPPHPP